MVKKTIELSLFLALLIIGVFVLYRKLPAYYYNKGVQFYEQGLYDNALTELSRAVKINPSIALVHYQLADVYLSKGLQGEAVSELEKVIKLEPFNLKAYSKIIRLYLNSEKYQDALKFMQQAKTINPSDKEIGELSQRLNFSYTAELLNKGVDSFLKGNKSEAYAFIQEAIKIMPDFTYAYYMLGQFYYIDRDFSNAERILRQLAARDAQFWPTYKLLGDVYFDRQEFQRAIDSYQAAVNLGAEDRALSNNLGLSYMEIENYQTAAIYLKQALGLDPDNANIIYSLASVNRDMGKIDEATPYYQRLIKIEPGYQNVHNDLGNIYKKQDKAQDAFLEYSKEIEYCKQKLIYDQNNAVVLNSLAYAYAGMGEYDEAQKIIVKVIGLKPDYRQAYITLSRIQELSGNLGGALSSINKAKSLSKNSAFVNRIQENLSGLKNIFLVTDKIYLKNGRVISGLITKETNEKLTVEMKVGESHGSVDLYRNDIERVERAVK